MIRVARSVRVEFRNNTRKRKSGPAYRGLESTARSSEKLGTSVERGQTKLSARDAAELLFSSQVN